MLKREVTIINKLGLHARAAMKLINLASRYQSEIVMRYNQAEINAKSILNVMALGAAQGSVIILEITGPDEQEAMDAIAKLINDRFDEDE